jgi:predicted RNA-binding protein YlqC (UPF0109 family)
VKVRLEDFVRDIVSIVRDICHHPDELRVQYKDNGTTLDLFLIPHRADAPLLNGANGRLLNSIKQVSLLVSTRLGKPVIVQLDENGDGEREPDHDVAHNWDGDVAGRIATASRWMNLLFGRNVKYFAQRKPDELEIRAEVSAKDDGAECTAITKLEKLNDLLYAWSRRRGLTMRIKPKK